MALFYWDTIYMFAYEDLGEMTRVGKSLIRIFCVMSEDENFIFISKVVQMVVVKV